MEMEKRKNVRAELQRPQISKEEAIKGCGNEQAACAAGILVGAVSCISTEGVLKRRAIDCELLLTGQV